MIFFLFFSIVSADFTEIKIGQINKPVSLEKGCNAFRIRTNYQRTKINIIPQSQLQATLQYTDVAKLKDCDKICPKSSAICGQLSVFDSSELIIGACTGNIYLYIDSDTKASINIIPTYLEGDCDKIKETPYTKCGAMSYEKCDRCGDECRVAHRISYSKLKKTEEVLASLCLPSDVGIKEVEDRCSWYKEVDNGQWKDKCDESLHIGSVGAGTIIALVLIMMSFFGFVGAVTWYNWKVKMTGVPPVKCHRCCPDILFPRPRPAPEQSYYTPPEISLQDFK